MQELKRFVPAAGGAPVAKHRHRITDAQPMQRLAPAAQSHARGDRALRPGQQAELPVPGVPEMPHARAAAVAMIETHAAHVGLRRNIKKHAGDIGVFHHQPLREAAFERQADNRAANMLGAKLIKPRLQRRIVDLHRHRNRDLKLMQTGVAFHRRGDL